MRPYYEHAGIQIFLGDCGEVLPQLGHCGYYCDESVGHVDEHYPADVLVTDPPFGIDYESGHFGVLPRSISGDIDTSLRDLILGLWEPRPALVMGSWRAPRPEKTRQVLIWDTQGALGMGALDLPWKPAHQEIYVIGGGFSGERTTDVLSFHPVQAQASNGRVHPHEKPVELFHALLLKCPAGIVLDPFMGSGTTLRAAKDLGRRAIGIEIEERYCEIAAKRLSQEVLDFAPQPG